MESCKHTNLVLLIEKNNNKLQCQKCHLTILADEIDDGYCPECFERSGQKIYDFKKLEIKESGKTRYRCEDCGTFIECE